WLEKDVKETALRAATLAGEKKGLIEGKIEGKIEGMIEGKIETAKKAILKGFDNQTIAELTELSIEKIEIIRSEQNKKQS
ncbi:MAG: hypothetical protein EAZ97_12625, partial [Bacteroidetes bacterium]